MNWLKIVFYPLLAIAVSSCAVQQPISSEPGYMLTLQQVKWTVITPDQQIKNKSILFALTEEDFAKNSANWRELNLLVANQQAIIERYKARYEPSN